MIDLLDALARMSPDPFLNAERPETPDEVFSSPSVYDPMAVHRANARAARESKEGSP